MKAVINCKLILENEILENGVLLIEDGRIAAFGTKDEVPVPAGADVIDAEGNYLAPGFIDIHTHASDRIFFMEDPLACAEYHLHAGTTSVYPALYFSMNTEKYVAAIRQMKEAMKEPRGANIAGVYMEGPYLNPKFGCDKEHCPWKGPIREDEYMPVIEAARDVACNWALAPEREGILDFVKAVRKLNPDAVFSVAHSEASPEQVEALIPYGLKIGTHHTDATGKVHKWPDVEILGVGVDEAVNFNDSIYAELIVDEHGIHVDPYMVKLVRKIKGDDRIILISDAYAADGPVPEGYEGVTDINFDWTGEIAGSKITLAQAVRNVMKHTGVDIRTAVKYATLNPARAIGLKDRGEIKNGLRADLVVIDGSVNVKKVILKGELTWQN